MADGTLSPLLRYLHTLVGGPAAATEDGRLLRNFLAGDQAAFAALVRRHGAMVLGVCRRVLGDAHDAEDAFQAAFLVLARKAASISRPERLAGWLYGVAYRTALKARTGILARSVRQRPLEHEPPTPADDGPGGELCPLLDEEVSRLPEKYRSAVVLCYLQGLTNEQAAEQLGCPKGTVLSRLSRARDLLRARLTRRGVALAAAGAVALPAEASAVPAALAAAAVAASLRFAAGGAPLTPAATLAQGVLQSMSIAKLKAVAAVALLCLLGSGVGLAAVRAWSGGPAPKPAPESARPADDKKEAPRDVKADDAPRAVARAVPAPRDQLDRSFDFLGFDNADITLEVALDYLAKVCDVLIDVNDRAFADAMLKDVRAQAIAERPLPPMKNARLATVLRRILARLPVEATVLVRDDRLEVTTADAARAEVGVARGQPLPPLVQAAFDKTPLDKALREVAAATGVNVVVDVRAADKAKVAVTADLANVPVDTAVRVLTDMAELKPVRLGNVLYVTTPENAARLQAEQAGEKK
jgi:RNA polymerase sigma factor (sigma-70 family)